MGQSVIDALNDPPFLEAGHCVNKRVAKEALEVEEKCKISYSKN